MRRGGASPFAVGLAMLVVLVLGLYFGFAKDVPFTHGFRVNAVFESANSIRKNSQIGRAHV